MSKRSPQNRSHHDVHSTVHFLWICWRIRQLCNFISCMQNAGDSAKVLDFNGIKMARGFLFSLFFRCYPKLLSTIFTSKSHHHYHSIVHIYLSPQKVVVHFSSMSWCCDLFFCFWSAHGKKATTIKWKISSIRQRKMEIDMNCYWKVKVSIGFAWFCSVLAFFINTVALAIYRQNAFPVWFDHFHHRCQQMGHSSLFRNNKTFASL